MRRLVAAPVIWIEIAAAATTAAAILKAYRVLGAMMAEASALHTVGIAAAPEMPTIVLRVQAHQQRKPCQPARPERPCRSVAAGVGLSREGEAAARSSSSGGACAPAAGAAGTPPQGPAPGHGASANSRRQNANAMRPVNGETPRNVSSILAGESDAE